MFTLPIYGLSNRNPIILDRGIAYASDSLFKIINTTDPTKQASFTLGSNTKNTTRTYTLPDTSGTLAAINLAQTWSAAQSFSGANSNSFLCGGAISLQAYKLTNTGSFVTTAYFGAWGGGVTVGTKMLYLDPVGTGTLMFIAYNDTGTKIARSVIDVINLGNTSTTEAGDLGFYTQTAGAAVALRLTVGATGLISTVPIRLKGYTVATLPAGNQGDTAFVTDALTPTYLTTAVGGGAVASPVFYNGSAWVTY